jgi:hypothetical protein
MIDVPHRDLVLAGGAALRVSGDGVDHDRVAALLAPYVVP